MFAIVFVGIAQAGDALLNDPDTHWHIKVGADIWRQRAAPWTDGYSHTFGGAPWIAKEWLSQILLFAADAAAGPRGLVCLTALAIAATFAMLFDWLAARLKFAIALAVTSLALSLLLPHALARPHIFALPPLLCWVGGLASAIDERRAPSLWLLPVIAVWANLHNSFVIAYPILGFMALEAMLRAEGGLRAETFRRWFVFGAAAVLAGCLTPYGPFPMLVPFMLFGSGEPLSFVNEWAPLGWTFQGVLTIVAAALMVGGLLAAGGLRNVGRILVVAMLVAMSIKHGRFVDLFAVAAPILVAAPVAARFPNLSSAAVELTSERPLWLQAASVAAIAVSLAFASTISPRHSAAVTPTTALAVAREAGVRGPVYNSYDFGGFLIREGVPTFIDGRSDQIFLGGFSAALMQAIGQTDSAALLSLVQRHGVRWAIMRSGSPEARHFESARDWRLLYVDDVAVVYVTR